jgi:hypothetical protein
VDARTVCSSRDCCLGRIALAPRDLCASRLPSAGGATLATMKGRGDYLRRYWFEFRAPREELPPGSWLGCGVTAVDTEDAERLLVAGPFRGAPLPPIERVVLDVDVSNLDAGHVVPNMADPTRRGVWFPRL